MELVPKCIMALWERIVYLMVCGKTFMKNGKKNNTLCVFYKLNTSITYEDLRLKV